MSFGYFYGDQSENYAFYRFPKQLMTGAQFKQLSMDAKVLYGLMLDRMGLSAKNGWHDELGRVYIFYTVAEIQEAFNCGHDRVLRMLAELDTEKGIGLIERKKQGQGKPTMIYVKQFTQADLPLLPSPQEQNEHFRHRKSRSQEVEETETKTSEKTISRLRETRCADVGQSEGNENNKNQTENSYTDLSIHLSDGWEMEQQVRDQIDYPLLSVQYPYDDPDCILQLICDVLTSTAETIRIGNENIPTQKVQSRFRRLDFEHVAYVLDSLRETTSKIKNIRAYLLTALYNAPLTIGPYYAAAVRHDFS